MKCIDFNFCPQSFRVYGGSAGRKNGLLYNGKNYLVKFPGSTSRMQNVTVSYTNSPLSEYIGSHIYEQLGIPVHKTFLGTKDGKLVVACEDFLDDSDHLYEFAQLKVTFLPHFVDSNGEITNGTGTDLQEILLTIEQHDMLKKLDGVQKHFWTMFIVDALIGNPDRNNGNWGIILHSDKTFSLAPVYDNGNSFNNKWDDSKMLQVMENPALLKSEVSEGKTCVFTLKNKRVNPYHLISRLEYAGCNEALLNLVPKILSQIENITRFINDIPEMDGTIPVISKTQKMFFATILQKRVETVFIPAYNKLQDC